MGVRSSCFNFFKCSDWGRVYKFFVGYLICSFRDGFKFFDKFDGRDVWGVLLE